MGFERDDCSQHSMDNNVRIEWAMWANEQAIISCVVLAFGSVLSVFSVLFEYPHVRWEIAAYSLVVSILIFILEYPRGHRRTRSHRRTKGRNQHNRSRMYQDHATRIVSSLGVFGRSYFIRFLMYMILCVPTLLQVGTISGGLSLIIAALIYLKAALENESWTPCLPPAVEVKILTRPSPPKEAPPRFITINPGRKTPLNGIRYVSVDTNDTYTHEAAFL